MENQTSDFISIIKNKKKEGHYKKHIDYIRFPYYKNFERNTKITFDYPITVFIGENGTGKSSVLKALYGCVGDKSIGEHWFSTKVDRIKDIGSERNCVIYNYTDKDDKAKDYEVLLSRMKRDNDPDYWEPSRPLVKYGMNRKDKMPNFRKPKIKMNAIYIDFHSLLSPFITYQFLLTDKKSRIDTKNYLRNKSRCLYTALSESKIMGPKEQNELPISFTARELEAMSYILGKKYTSGKIINNKFFKVWGTSIYLCEDKGEVYSDAFAGSGETAVGILVHKLSSIEKNSLVLLDEPELSLHPGAQKKLFEYLQSICLGKKLQIVISTHSPEFIKNLPNEAIKVFSNFNGQISVSNKNNESSAFYTMGADISEKTIYVEDVLAQCLVNSIIKDMGDDVSAQIHAVAFTGGESHIRKYIGGCFESNNNSDYFLFDGDMYQEFVDYSNIPTKDCTVEKLEEIVGRKYLKCIPSDSNETIDIKEDRLKRFIDFARNRIRFLPCENPEVIIWDDDYSSSLTKSKDGFSKIGIDKNFKKKYETITEFLCGSSSSSDILTIQKMFVMNFIKKTNNPDLELIKRIIKDFIDI